MQIPIAPSTAVKPSTTGISAATSAPKASSRIASVIGSDVYSARLKSFVTVAPITWLALAMPNSSIRYSGFARCVPATASSAAWMCLSALSALPRTSNWMIAERPSDETSPVCTGSSGERMFVSSGRRSSVWTSDAIATV